MAVGRFARITFLVAIIVSGQAATVLSGLLLSMDGVMAAASSLLYKIVQGGDIAGSAFIAVFAFCWTMSVLYCDISDRVGGSAENSEPNDRRATGPSSPDRHS